MLKPNLFEEDPSQRVSIFGDDGVMDTSKLKPGDKVFDAPPVKDTEELPVEEPLDFINIPEDTDVIDDSGLAGDIASAESAPSFEERAQTEFQENFKLDRYGDFTPGSLSEALAVRQGRIGASFDSGLNSGIIGKVLRWDEMSIEDKDKLNAEMQHAAERAGIRSFFANIGGRFLSDAPLEIAMMAATGPLINVLKAGTRALRGANAVRTAKALRATSATVRQTGKLGKAGKTALADSLEGFAAGYLSESVIQNMEGRDNHAAVMKAAIGDALVSPVFGALMRGAMKIGGRSLSKVKRGITKGIEDTQLSKQEVNVVVNDAVDNSRSPDVPDKPPIKLRENISKEELLIHFDQNTRLDDLPTVKAKFKELMPDSSDADVDNFVKYLQGRGTADYRGSISKLLKRHVLHNIDPKKPGNNVNPAESIPKLIDDYNRVLAAPTESISPGVLYASLADIMFSDISKAAAKRIKKVLGFEKSEVTEELRENLRELIEKGRSDPKSLTPEETLAFKDAMNWSDKVYFNLYGNQLDLNPKGTLKQLMDMDTAQTARESKVDQSIDPDAPTAPDEAVVPDETAVPDEAVDPNRKLTPEERELRDQASQEAMEASNTQVQTDILEANSETINKGWLANNRFLKLFNKNIAFFGAFNLNKDTLLEGLGETFAKYNKRLSKALIKEESLVARLTRMAQSEADGVGFSRADESFLNNEFDVTVGGKKQALSGLELLNLHMYASDVKGNHPASSSLLSHGYRTSKGTPLAFSPEQVKEMATETWLINNVGEQAVRAKVAARGYLNEGLKILNEESMKRLGFTQIDPANLSYYMKRTNADDASPDEISSTLDRDLDKAVKTNRKSEVIQSLYNTTALNRLRQGNAELKFQNPLEASLRYSQQLARMVAMADDLAGLSMLNRGSKQTISDGAGKNVYNAINELINSTAGKYDPVADPIERKIKSFVFRGQLLASLAYNVVTPFKQLGSVAAAFAKLDPEIGKNRSILKYMSSVTPKVPGVSKRDELHDYMLANVPLYFNRWNRTGPGPDIDDMRLSNSFSQAIFGDSTIRQAVKDKGLVKGGAAKIAEKGMLGIKEADALALRAIYKAVDDEIKLKNPELEGDALQDAITERFSDIINESQPTTHPLTRSINQNSQSLLKRSFTMFSSQPVKNFNLMVQNIAKWQNEPTAENKLAMQRMVKGMMVQAAYITAVGAGVTKGREFVLDMVRDEEVVDRKDAFREKKGRTELGDLMFRAMRDIAGNVPVSGAITADAISAMMGGGKFGFNVLGVDSANDFVDFLDAEETWSERNIWNLVNATGKLVGVPKELSRATKAMASNL